MPSVPIPARVQNAVDRDLDSALHIAIRDNAIDTAILLLQEGAPVHATNAKRVTPLILAAQKGFYCPSQRITQAWSVSTQC